MQIELNWRFLPHQWAAFQFQPRDRFEVCALLGGWGSGKTRGAAMKAIAIACRNPWTPAYGSARPQGLILAPTHKILRQSTMTEFDRVCPPELIMKRRGPPYQDITLRNGFRFLLNSGESSVEGLTVSMAWIDEVSHPVWASNPHRFLNLMARIRDKDANRLAMIVSGIPESGWVKDTFDKQTPNRICVLAATKDNPHIPQETMTEFYASCPSGQEEKLLGGLWMPPSGAIYPQFDASHHLIDDPGDPRAPCDMSIDVGNQGAVLFGQSRQVRIRDIVGRESKDDGLHIVDQMITIDESVDRMCYRAKTEKPWQVVRGASIITVDPVIRRDELHAIRKHFPEVRIVKRERGHEFYPIESGIRCVQRALRDALGNSRLTFDRKVAAMPNGVIDGLGRYRRNEFTGLAVKDNSRDHCLDALRYLVCERLQPERSKVRVLDG